MANKKINELVTRTPSLSDLILVGDPSSGYSYKATVTALATIIETDIADGFVTLSTTQTISGVKIFSNNLTLTSVANAATTQTKFLTLNASNVVNYRTGAEVLADIGGQGTISLAAIGSTPNANGATLSSNTLTLQPASASFGGVLTTGFQEIAGWKRFTGNPIQFDNHLEIKNLNSWGVSWGYTSFASKNTPVFGFLRGDNSAGNITYNAWFTYGTTGDRNYTLPSTDGTLALTSDITSSISGTTNYIPKFTSSSAIGNSVIYEASGSIGVGTITPVANTPLTLQAASGYTDILWLKSAGTNIDARINMAPTGTGLAQLNNTNGTGIAFQISGSEQMRLTSTGLGIGTSSPAYKLDVSGNAHIGTGDSRLIIGDVASANTESVIWLRTGSGKYAYSIAAQSLADESLTIARSTTQGGTTFSTASLTLNSSGNLGLGVTPSAWASGYKVLQMGAGSVASFGTTFMEFGQNTFYDNSYKYVNNGFASNYYQNAGGHFWFTAPSGTAGNAISFTQAMTLDASGNLALGTTASLSSAANRVDLTINGSSTSMLTFGVNGTRRGYLISNGTDLTLSNTVSGATIFSTNDTERMRITSSGLVGIGTTSPTQKLDVVISSGAYNTRFHNSSTSTSDYNVILVTQGASGSATGYFGTGGSVASNTSFANTFVIGTQSNSAFVLNTNDTERMRITSSGNVGIGTTSPAYKLDVNGAIASTSGDIYATDGTRTNFFGVSTGSNIGVLGMTTNHDLRVITNNTERMRITSGGNVGIGVSSPNTQLQINGTPSNDWGNLTLFDTRSQAADRGGMISFGGYKSTTSTEALFAQIKGNKENGTSGNEAGYLAFFTNNNTTYAERMRITSTGNVLIGTTTNLGAGIPLQVNGKIAMYGSELLFKNAGNTQINVDQNYALLFATNDTERMRITSSGELLINTTSNSATSNVGSKFVSNGRLFTVSSYSDNTQESLSMYSTTASAYRFYVGWGGTVYATNTTISAISDIRYKENVRDLDSALNKLMLLKPRVFDWKEGMGKNIKNDKGFIAQEFEQIFPELVDKWKEKAPQGEEPYKSIRQDLIPYLVKAIQELKAEIETLKNK